MNKKNKNIHNLRDFVTSLMTGVAVLAMSSSVVYADEEKSGEAITPYKISSQSTSTKSYLKDSPYVVRHRQLEEGKPSIRRRPMRFTNGGELPEVPKFDDGFNEPLVSVDDTIRTVEPVEIQPVQAIEPIETMPVKLPSHIDDVEMVVPPVMKVPAVEVNGPIVEMVAPPVIRAPSIEVDEPIVEMVAPPVIKAPSVEVVEPIVERKIDNNQIKPKSLVDSVLSVFDRSDKPKVKNAIALPPTINIRPIVNPNPRAPMQVRPRTQGSLGVPLKTIVIEKAPAGHSSLENTRQIITPPELQKIQRESKMAKTQVPPLMLTRDRFKDDLVAVPPTSNLAAISKEITPPELPKALPVQEVAQSEFPKPAVIQPEALIEPPVKQAVIKTPLMKKSALVEATAPQAQSALAAITQEVMKEEPIAVPAQVAETAMVKEMPATKAFAKPMQNQVIMQKRPQSNHKQLASLTDKNVVIEEAKQVELTKESKMMLKNFPTGLNAPEVKMQNEKVEISRATVPDLEISKPLIKKHEALGISIEVKKPDLNVNDYLVMAYEAMQAGKLSLASEYYQAILDGDGNHEDALLGLATVSHRLGDSNSARALYRKILMTSPRNTDVLNNFLVLVSEEAPEKALRELSDLESKNPHYDVLPAQLAAIYANQGDMENAIAKIIRAIELNPGHLLYRYNLAVMLDHAGQKSEAIQAYAAVKKALEKGDKIPTDLSHIQERLTFLLSNQSS